MNVQTEPSVLWREGMFLCPQHLQAFARELGARIGRGEGIGSPGAFGLARLEVDEEALERDLFRVLEAEVVFPDGTLAHFPRTATVEARELGEHFRGAELDVWLGVQTLRPRGPQLAEGESERGGRWRARVQEVWDENLHEAGRELEFRELLGRLFFGEEEREGHECVRIARLVRRGKPVAKTALSPTFVPPLLACAASPALVAALGAVTDAVREHARDLAARLPDTAALSSADRGADLAGFVKLLAANRSVATLEQVRGLPALHPYDAYMRLVEAVGSLAIFGPGRTVPALPVYDHGDLDRCFRETIAALRALVVAEVSVPYDVADFRKDPARQGFHVCELPEEWLERAPLYFLGVELERTAEEARELVGTSVKLVAPGDVDRVLQGVVPGIALTHVHAPPLAFPKREGLHYFRVETEKTSRDAWLRVVEAREALLLSALAALGAEARFALYVELDG